MKKFLLSSFIVFAFIGYAIFLKLGNDEESKVVAPPTSLQGSNSNPQAGGIQGQMMPETMPGGMMAKYKDGQYTGSLEDAYYGNVKVQVTVQNSKIADVIFLEYPNDRRTSVEINSQAMPYLKQEAIQAQSANVDVVSGATQTSLAFRQSLMSALNQARS